MNGHYILTFATSGGKTKQLRVSSPDTALPQGVVTNAGVRMINSNVITTSSGAITVLKKVDLQTVTKTQVI